MGIYGAAELKTLQTDKVFLFLRFSVYQVNSLFFLRFSQRGFWDFCSLSSRVAGVESFLCSIPSDVTEELVTCTESKGESRNSDRRVEGVLVGIFQITSKRYWWLDLQHTAVTGPTTDTAVSGPTKDTRKTVPCGKTWKQLETNICLMRDSAGEQNGWEKQSSIWIITTLY